MAFNQLLSKLSDKMFNADELFEIIMEDRYRNELYKYSKNTSNILEFREMVLESEENDRKNIIYNLLSLYPITENIINKMIEIKDDKKINITIVKKLKIDFFYNKLVNMVEKLKEIDSKNSSIKQMVDEIENIKKQIEVIEENIGNEKKISEEQEKLIKKRNQKNDELNKLRNDKNNKKIMEEIEKIEKEIKEKEIEYLENKRKKEKIKEQRKNIYDKNKIIIEDLENIKNNINNNEEKDIVRKLMNIWGNDQTEE